MAISLTHIAGRHTIKGGYYLNHSYKAQNADVTFQGTVNFGNDTNNALDTGFGYANAALGVFTQYTQAVEVRRRQHALQPEEFYVQDNWKVTSRLTLDYGMRFVNQQPQYDQFKQMSNFFPDKWKASDAQVLYIAGCSNGAVTCSGNIRNAMDPRTRADSDGGGRGEHAGGNRDTDSRHGQSAERDYPGGQWDREDELYVAEDGGGAAVRVCVRRDGEIELGDSRRRRAVLRPAGREHGVLDPGQSADRDDARTCATGC